MLIIHKETLLVIPIKHKQLFTADFKVIRWHEISIRYVFKNLVNNRLYLEGNLNLKKVAQQNLPSQKEAKMC